jgi:hypothetical protein
MGHPNPTCWCPYCTCKKVVFLIRRKNKKDWYCNNCEKLISKNELIALNPRLAPKRTS